MPRGSLALALLALSVVLPACGGGAPTAEELERTVLVARDRTDDALQRITEARSEEELLARMDEAAATIADAAGDLERTGAAEGYEAEVDDLVEALSQLAFDVQATADQIRDPGFRDLVVGARGLSFESWDAANRALAALSRKGIAVAPLERH